MVVKHCRGNRSFIPEDAAHTVMNTASNVDAQDSNTECKDVREGYDTCLHNFEVMFETTLGPTMKPEGKEW
jgi:hypothetical protein